MSDKREAWSKRIAAWECGGQTRVAFCVQRGLSVHTFDYWRRMLRSAASAPRDRSARNGFVPVQVATPRAPVPLAEIVLPNGSTVRVSPSIDPAQLRALLQVVQSC